LSRKIGFYAHLTHLAHSWREGGVTEVTDFLVSFYMGYSGNRERKGVTFVIASLLTL